MHRPAAAPPRRSNATPPTGLRTRRTEHGAGLVEVAVIAPLFLALILGVVELSVWMLDVNALRNAARIGAHEGATSASSSLADYNILRGVMKGLTGNASPVDGVVIFKASGPDAAAPAACTALLNGVGDGVAGLCNVYSPTRLKTLDPLHFGYTPVSNADASLWDRQWPATTRRDTLSGTAGTDLVGVYVRTRHQSFTGVLKARTLTAQVVMPIEPQRAE